MLRGRAVISGIFRVLWVLWAGSLWSLSLWVAPTLFYAQPDQHVAGILAARLFSIETYLGLGVAVLALLLRGRGQLVPVYMAVVLLAINEGVVKRVMTLAHARGAVAGLSFGAWHGVSALLYVVACLLVLVVVWNQELRGGR